MLSSLYGGSRFSNVVDRLASLVITVQEGQLVFNSGSTLDFEFPFSCQVYHYIMVAAGKPMWVCHVQHVMAVCVLC
jgi:hypothetical protein